MKYFNLKKIIFTIVILLLITLSIIPSTRNQIARFSTTYIKKNKVIVNVSNVDINDIMIMCYTAQDSSKIIFKEGGRYSRIKNEHGGDNFEVYLKDSLIAKCGIFKINWWHTHKYTFSISKINDTISVDFKAIGKSSDSGYYNTK